VRLQGGSAGSAGGIRDELIGGAVGHDSSGSGAAVACKAGSDQRRLAGGSLRQAGLIAAAVSSGGAGAWRRRVVAGGVNAQRRLM
jgi:hypothetical protein